jgi:hypothetical protein
MSTPVAAINVLGSVLRYAETQPGTPRRLTRLGSCEFDFDVAREIMREGTPGRLDDIAEALADAFAGTETKRWRIAVHPPDGYSFFVPLQPDLSDQNRRRRLLQQAALLTGARTAKAFKLRTQPVRVEYVEQEPEGTQESVDWYHVTALPSAAQDHLLHIIDGLPRGEYLWAPSTQGGARVVAATERTGVTEQLALRPYTLAVGRYPGHTEYVLCHDSRWHYSHYAETDVPDDQVYFAVSLLNRLGIPQQAVGRLFAYGQRGDDRADELLQEALGSEVEPLDPLRTVDVEQEAGNFDALQYVPSIGLTLRRVSGLDS